MFYWKNALLFLIEEDIYRYYREESIVDNKISI